MLGTHEKLLLLSVARLLQACDHAYIPFGAVEREYQAACEEYGVQPRRHTQLWKYLKVLSMGGLVRTKRSGRGRRGQTTMLGLPAPSALLRSELERLLEEALKG